MYRVLNLRSCKKDFYKRSMRVDEVTTMQIGYKYRLGESINRTRILFSPGWLLLSKSAMYKVPNLRYMWKPMRPNIAQEVVNDNNDNNNNNNNNNHQPQVLIERTTVREVMDCKTFGSMVNSYLPRELLKNVNWESNR